MEFETIPTPLDLSTKEKKEATVLTDESFADLSFIRLGAGAKSIILDIQTGMYVGAEQFTSAPFSVDFDGKVIASNIEITGGSVSGVSLSGLASGTDINIFGWTSTMTFSATDYRTVTWTSGVITLADGTTFNIGTGNTGNMAAVTYIYFDKAVSTTALQVTTTAATAVGANKILIAVAQNNSDTTSKATLQVFGGKGGQLITVDNIAANSASVNEFISNTAQIKDAIISNAKITSLAADKITAGTITSQAITLAVTDTAGDVKIQAGKTDFGQNTTNGFILGIDDSDSNTVKFELTGGYISGGTIQTNPSTSGVNTRLSGSVNNIDFRYNNSSKAYIIASSDGSAMFDADAGMYLVSNDEMYIEYNENGGSDSILWVDDGNWAMQLHSNHDLDIEGDVSAANFDFAELFESIEEFSKEKIPNGTPVIVIGDKIRPAKSGEIPIGVISATAGIVLNNGGSDAGSSWGKKYIRNELGEKQYKEEEWWYLPKMEERTIKRKTKNLPVKGWVKDGNVPVNAKTRMKRRLKLNPEYDESKKYTPRKERPEWNIVGLIGRCRLLKGSPVDPRWIKLKDISDNVEEWLIK